MKRSVLTMSLLNRSLILAQYAAGNPLGAAHALPRVFGNRLLKRSPLTDELPWMPYPAIAFLEQTLKPHHRVLEFGSGGSTLFLARRVGSVVSVEHDPGWGQNVRTILEKQAITHVDYRIIPPEQGNDPPTSSDVAPYAGMNFSHYLAVLNEFGESEFDVLLIDGRVRNQCVRQAWPKLKAEGILLLDNSDRPKYQPAINSLAAHPSQKFYGLNPYQFDPGETTAWWKHPPTQ
jgi:hypothetical protein